MPKHDSELQLTRRLTADQCATVLAALRLWQEHRHVLGLCVPSNFDHFDDAKELTSVEIDRLCEAINLQPVVRLISTDNAARALRRYVERYESDTFSASGMGMTPRQLDGVIAGLIRGVMDHLDGVTIAGALDDFRARR